MRGAFRRAARSRVREFRLAHRPPVAAALPPGARGSGAMKKGNLRKRKACGPDEVSGDGEHPTGGNARATDEAHVSKIGRGLRYPTLEELDLALPMPVDDAQKTGVFLHQGFLSAAEAERLIRRFNRLGLQPYTNVPDQDYNARGAWVHITRYLQEGDCFRTKFPKLRARVLALARRANEENGWGLDMRSISVRVAELHNYRKGGALLEMDHYDKGSLVTVDVMLEPPVRGGRFQTVEVPQEYAARAGAGAGAGAGVCREHDFDLGDALVFVSHKYHRVAPVEEVCRCEGERGRGGWAGGRAGGRVGG